MSVRPDKSLVTEVAALKSMKESFVEKDWLVTQVICLIQEVCQEGFEVVFSGGTALSKAHHLLFRFSEDIDFRVLVKPQFSARKSRSHFKHAVVNALRTAGFAIEASHVTARDENRFFAIDLEYYTDFPRENALRPHIQIEMTMRDVQLPTIALPVYSFLNELAKRPPEVPSIQCINPVESAADKLSAIAWRIPDRIRGDKYDDASIVRHIHDLYMLKDRALAHVGFADLLSKSMQEDNARAKNDITLKDMPIVLKLQKMLDILEHDRHYPEEYTRFVEEVSYADFSGAPSFASAVSAVQMLVKAVS